MQIRKTFGSLSLAVLLLNSGTPVLSALEDDNFFNEGDESSSMQSQDLVNEEEENSFNRSPYDSSVEEETISEAEVDEQVLSGEVISIPAGSSSAGVIDRGLNSSNSRVGDKAMLVLQSDLAGIPAGSKIEFEVSMVDGARRGFDNPGEMQLKTTRVIYSDGSSAPLLGGYVVTDPSKNIIEGNTKGKRAAAAAGKTTAGAATGALGGLIGSAIGGGSLGKATAIGAGIGAGVGLGAAAFGKGREVNISSGQKLFVKFNQASSVGKQ